MSQASVGFHCPECVRGGGQKVYTARSLPSASAAIVTTALVALNVAAHVVSSIGSGLGEPSFGIQLDYALIGRALSSEGLIGVAEGEWYRLVTGGFLHGGLIHLGMNMFILWILGKQLEASLGSVAFGAIYLTSLLAGSFGVMLLDPEQLTVGASGAVYGLFGYTLVAQVARGINPMQNGIGGIILLNLAFTFVFPNVSIGGHVGGLAGGIVAGVLYDGARRRLGLSAPIGVALVVVFGVACAVGSVLVV